MSLERAATVAAAVLGIPAAAVATTALVALALSACGRPAPTPAFCWNTSSGEAAMAAGPNAAAVTELLEALAAG